MWEENCGNRLGVSMSTPLHTINMTLKGLHPYDSNADAVEPVKDTSCMELDSPEGFVANLKARKSNQAEDILESETRKQKLGNFLSFAKKAHDFRNNVETIHATIEEEDLRRREAEAKKAELCEERSRKGKRSENQTVVHARNLQRRHYGVIIKDFKKQLTAEKWYTHLALLVTVMMLIPIARGEVHLSATYFAVAKGNNKARAIFNGKALNKFLGSAPPINLPVPQELLRKLARLKGRKAILTADIRHWFHQIELSPEVSAFFGVAFKDEKNVEQWFRWATLPMGTSWSPYVAQCLAWTILILILAGQDDEIWPFKMNKDDVLLQPPRWLELKQGGFVTVYLDNIIIVGSDELVKDLHKRIDPEGKNQFKQRFGVDLKECYIRSSEEWERTPIEFLGVEILRMNTTGTNNATTKWRPTQEKAEKWQKEGKLIWSRIETGKATHRDIARLTGRALWCHSLSMEPLCRVHDIINILRRSAKARGTGSWDSVFPLPEEEKSTAFEHLQKLATNEWQSDKRAYTKTSKVFACSDASGNGWGFVIYGAVLTVAPGRFTPNQAQHHIFIKEFLAAEKCIDEILRCHKRQTDTHLEIVIGIDNSAVAQVLRNLYTANTFIQPGVSGLADRLEKGNASLQVINVRSEDNAADEPSRNKVLTEAKAKKTKHILDLGLLGQRANEYNLDDAPRMNGWIRTLNENEDEGDECLEDIAEALVECNDC
jgi:hypothetical protein